MEPIDTDRWPLEEAGPFDRCLRCFTPNNDDRAYCTNCGKGGSFFATSNDVTGKMCTFHPHVLASAYCALCTRPICSACVAREGFSLAAFCPTPQCHFCIDDMARLEAKYLQGLHDRGCCAKHPNKCSVIHCSVCNIPLCGSCVYYKHFGFMWRKAKPYCLTCRRIARYAS